MAKELARAPARETRTATAEQSHKLLGRMALKYGVDARQLLATLRDTVFVVKEGEPPFTDNEIAAGLIIAEKYDLDPFVKELYLTRSRGKLLTIVPVDGWSKIVNEHPQYDGVEFDWENREDGQPIRCICRMYRKDRTHPTVIDEFYEECYRPSKYDDSPWNKWPRRMLRHKAFIQAARICFGIHDVVDDDEAARYARPVETPDYSVHDEPRQAPREIRQPAAESSQQPSPAPERSPPADAQQPPATAQQPPATALRTPATAPKSSPASPSPNQEDPTPMRSLWKRWNELRKQLTDADLEQCSIAADEAVIHPGVGQEKLELAVHTAEACLANRASEEGETDAT